MLMIYLLCLQYRNRQEQLTCNIDQRQMSFIENLIVLIRYLDVVWFDAVLYQKYKSDSVSKILIFFQ